MAATRLAAVTAAQAMGPDSRIIELAMVDRRPLGFIGGQHIIIDAGLDTATGRTVKRAYSILSDDRDQFRVLLATKRISAGAGSGFMHDLTVGDQVKFAGPLGKLLPPERAGGRALVLATDTGITAALGLMRGRGFASTLPLTDFLWLRPDPTYFLSEAFVNAVLAPGLGRVNIGLFPTMDDPRRIAHARAVLGDRLAEPGGVTHVFLAGDGTVNFALTDDLLAAGVSIDRIRTEAFFNIKRKTQPELSAP